MIKLSRLIGAAKLALHAKSPTILVVGGVITMGAAAIVACKKTLELEEVLEPFQEDMEKVKDDGNEAHAVRVQMAIEVGKVYLLPVGMFLLGAGMTFKGHSIMQQRNAALAMAFTTLKKTLDNYRQRVIAEQGHEADQRFMNGAKDAIVNKNGYSQRVDSRDWENADDDLYNRVFSNETSSKWQNDLGANKHFVASQQRFAQQLLNRQGYIYLSTVYKSLGIAESDTSRICGWKITTLPDGTRNIPIVDFGIDKPIADDWKYNQDKAIYLDFNCQGLIVGGKVQKMVEAAAAVA